MDYVEHYMNLVDSGQEISEIRDEDIFFDDEDNFTYKYLLDALLEQVRESKLYY